MRQKKFVIKYLLAGFILLIINSIGYAQSFSIGHAVPLWGNTSKAVQVNASVSYITVSYIHIYMNNPVDERGMRVNKNFLGIYYAPTIDREVAEFLPEPMTVMPMIGFMHEPYPNEGGQQLHFGISLSWELEDHMDLYYKHISNGYLGTTNVGIDTFGLRVKLKN